MAAHVNQARGFAKQKADLPLVDSWDIYIHHPYRAMPQVHETLAYQASFSEFVEFATRPVTGEELRNRIPHTRVHLVKEVTPTVALEFAEYLRRLPIAVDTHIRKIRRIRKVFSVLKDYYNGDNPFRAKTLFRKPREEQNSVVRRQAFTREEENRLLEELRSPAHRLMNKWRIIHLRYTL